MSTARSGTAPGAVAARCLAIVGPTASGKSAAAMALADSLAPHRRVEIVSVDSAQVYRCMDIGTAKPSAAERARVPHHGIDLVDPTERYSAARFVRDATAAIAAIESRGALPLLVGGTMLYLKALVDGLAPMPEGNPAVRAVIDADAARDGWPALHARLATVDPGSAGRIAPGDSQRIQRALEVWQASGRTMTQWHAAADADAPRLRLAVLSLEPTDRAWLHARIDARFAAMLDAGLVDEVRGLRARGDLDASLPSMRAVGYRQAWAALDNGNLHDLHATGSVATRRLAKRQLTWLRSMPQRHVIACDAPGAVARVVEAATRMHDDG